MPRSNLTTPLSAEDITLDQVIEHLRQWRTDTASTRDTVQAMRQSIAEVSRQLENPNAAFEYLDFFSGMFDRAAADFDKVIAALPGQFLPEHGDLLRQIASNGALEQRRTLMFRDKWVNKPLPYEQVRPLLTQMANDVRGQLTDYKELTLAAAKLAQLAAPPAPPDPPPAPPIEPERGFDRRALFTKLIRPLGDEGQT